MTKCNILERVVEPFRSEWGNDDTKRTGEYVSVIL